MDAGPGPGRRRAAGLFWAGVTVCIFAGWFVVTRVAVTHVLRSWDIAALRFGVGLLVLAPLLRRRPFPPRAWREGAVFSVLWGAPFVLLLGFGVQRTSAGEASAITPTLTPLFSGLFAWAMLKQRPGRARFAGFAAIGAGVVALVLVNAASGGAPDPLGLLCLVSASAVWAVYTVLFRSSRLDPVQSAWLICFWSCLAFLPVYLGLGLSHLHLASWDELLVQGVYQGVLMSAVGIVTFNRAAVLLGPTGATSVVALLPAVAAALAVPVLGEVPGLLQALSITVIAGGVLLAARPDKPAAS